MQEYNISSTDGVSNKLSIFDCEESKAVIAIFPAMGVRASYYQSLAEELSNNNFTAITIDLRGNGHSSIRPSRKVNFGYHEMIEYDYPMVVEYIKKHYPNQAIYLLGHSLGGQLASLYTSKNPNEIQGLILIACCSVYYKGWFGMQRVQTLLATQAFNLIGNVLGYFPGRKIGFGELEAQGVMNDWAKQARTGKYVLANSNFDFEKALKQVELPVLAISFEGDNLAPKQAVDNLLTKFALNQNQSHLHLEKDDPRNEKYNHFNWVKKPKGVVEIIEQWMS